MKRALLFGLVSLVYINGMMLQAQALIGSCPIPTPPITWSSLSASDIGTSFASSVYIVGSFTVDITSFTFIGAEVAVVDDVSIIVNSGCTLRIENNSVITNAQGLWNGITVLPGGHLVIEDSEVCGAINAVYMNYSGSGSPASFDIQDSHLGYNETSIYIANYSGGTYPGYVVGTHFNGGVLATGGTYSQSYQGVYAHNVTGGDGLTIGDENTLASVNTFSRMDFGIHGMNSTLNVWNNSFEDLQDFASMGYGCAVYANVSPAPGTPILSVGTSSTRTNYMLDCRVGVYSRGMRKVNVSDNQMDRTTEPFEVGVWITRTDDTIVVGGNTIRHFDDVGILLDENPGSSGGPVDASVNNDTLEGSLEETRGIVVDDLVGGVTIRDNLIEEVHRGIIAQYLQDASQVRIDHNEVHFRYSGTSSEPAVGILAVLARAPSIFRNEISGNCPYSTGGGPCTTPSMDNSRIRGIQLIKTDTAQLFSNYVEYSGAGLYLYQDNFEGNAVCNEFHDCYSGVVWDNVGTAEFGKTFGATNRVYGILSDTASSDNRWTSSVGGSFEPIRSYSISGSDANSVDWYYRNATTYDFPAGTNLFVSPSTLLSIITGESTAICSQLPMLLDSGYYSMGEGSYEGGYMESMVADFLSEQESSLLQPALYAYLSRSYRSEGSSSLVASAIERTNIPLFRLIASLWQTGQIDSAVSILSAIVPVNAEEDYLKEIWFIRLSVNQNEFGYVWSATEREYLTDIAYRDMEDAGSAVILAQSLLGITHIPDSWLLDNTDERFVNPELISTTLFPNPAQAIVYLSGLTSNSNVSVLDLQGKEWKHVSVSYPLVTISVSDLPNGLYLVQIRSQDGELTSMKLSIAR